MCSSITLFLSQCRRGQTPDSSEFRASLARLIRAFPQRPRFARLISFVLFKTTVVMTTMFRNAHIPRTNQ